jgi:hypothetical protein
MANRDLEPHEQGQENEQTVEPSAVESTPEPTAEEVAAARKRLEEAENSAEKKDAEELEKTEKEVREEFAGSEGGKAEAASKTIFEGYQREVDSRTGQINQNIERACGSAEKLNVWEEIRGKIAEDTRWKLSIESKGVKKSDSDTLFGKVAHAINEDVFEERRGKTQDATDFDAGAIVTQYIEEHGGKFEGEQLAEVQKALELLSLNGQYKFFKLQNSSQLESVIAAQQKLAEASEGFNLEETGFSETVSLLENGTASLNLDLASKPNFEYARPEYPKRQQDCQRMLLSASKVEATIKNK